ncbi:hypothetical protein TVAG_310090 [Trichomonas vaginalis G3]|uniref:Ubiquitin-like domain-containing protein n=1 Tax=Trichomonas vaginalis (strain ATCC PRA-98 / G3) TaxID=412133 RepID=A2EKS5_TRIV3|nr:hypothetical protein TVAGG3_0865360 [Trichomonas vaginalis G3]EAY06722.1 hypothetical protein TVAG_310090 [Trichomonas vaginalis G3]KAI5500984.1 hypothetical protein TVAGG3_0865360 [Trichomonas vaginalis G3]|eukprot:XP_001318945.1 hypothetical protein [Trichomonas vaginalis G3]
MTELSTNLVRVTLPDKLIQFIEVGPNETYGDVCKYIKKNYEIPDSMVLIPQTDIKLQENSKISDDFKDKVLRISVKNEFDHEAQFYLDSINREKNESPTVSYSEMIGNNLNNNTSSEGDQSGTIPLPISSLLSSLVDMDTEPDYNRFNYM